MIPRNYDLVAVRKFSEPSVEIFDRRVILAERAEIPGVNQYVAIRDIYAAVEYVSVAQEDKSKLGCTTAAHTHNLRTSDSFCGFPINSSQ
jgi:hypothetical protein